MKLPAIIVNFKNYESATGDGAVELAKVHDRVAKETGVSIAVAVGALDLAKVVDAVDIPVFVQHMDPVGYGSSTGGILPSLVKDIGAYGTLLNHAEKPLEFETLKKSIEAAHSEGLFTVVCANDENMARRVVDLNPGLIAVEPPELIGGDVSVAKADPGIIERSVDAVGEGRLLVGAGVKTAEDVEIALALGASGVLLASGVTKAGDSNDVYAVLNSLAGALG